MRLRCTVLVASLAVCSTSWAQVVITGPVRVDPSLQEEGRPEESIPLYVPETERDAPKTERDPSKAERGSRGGEPASPMRRDGGRATALPAAMHAAPLPPPESLPESRTQEPGPTSGLEWTTRFFKGIFSKGSGRKTRQPHSPGPADSRSHPIPPPVTVAEPPDDETLPTTGRASLFDGISAAPLRLHPRDLFGSGETDSADLNSSAGKTASAVDGLAAGAALNEATCELWMEWGGLTSTPWHGSVSLSHGKFSSVQAHGLARYEPGSIYLDGNQIRIEERSPRRFDCIRVTVHAPRNAMLHVNMASAHGSGPRGDLHLRLDDILQQTQVEKLDDHGNQLIVRRAAAHDLKLSFAREHLVFRPREGFDFSVQPLNPIGPPKSFVQVQAALFPHGASTPVWSEEQDVFTDARGRLPNAAAFLVEMPRHEGVYDLTVRVAPIRSRAPLSPSVLPVTRRLQLVVVAPVAPPAAATGARLSDLRNDNWHLVGDIDATESAATTRSHRVVTREHQGRSLLHISPGGWHSIALPRGALEQPHILEIDYADDIEQDVSFCILQPNAAGEVVMPDVDTGVSTRDSEGGAAIAPLRTHRIVYWPKSDEARVVIANRHPEAMAIIGHVRVYAGPAALTSEPPQDERGRRLLAAYYDQPLFPQNFGGRDTLDASGRALKDWATFYEGATRLIDFLKFSGYNAAVIMVARDGSTIYPSELLAPTPRYDNGVFFTTAQDPLRKDVLELLFRLFDREGLTLIPAVRFSSPLPELERLRRTEGADGLDLVDSEQRTWVERQATGSRTGALYNPLDPRVQEAMRHVIDELIARYAGHDAFGGVAISLGRDTFAQLPGADWGADEVTWSRFAAAQSTTTASLDDSQTRRRWLAWRAQSLSQHYERLQRRLMDEKPTSRLLLMGARGDESDRAAGLTAPVPARSDDVRQTYLACGLDAALLAQIPGVVFLKTHVFDPVANASGSAANICSPQQEQLFYHAGNSGQDALRNRTGVFFFHESPPHELDAFRHKSPWGPERTQVTLASQFALSGPKNRQRFVHDLCAGDVQVIVEGGRLVMQGQDRRLHDLFHVFRQLPDTRFKTVVPASSNAVTQPVTLRTATVDGQTFLYAANDSPWAIHVDLELHGAGAFNFSSLSSRSIDPVHMQGERGQWSVDLEPYEVVGVVFESPSLRVVDWHASLTNSLLRELDDRLAVLEARIDKVRRLDLKPLPTLLNSSFEKSH